MNTVYGIYGSIDRNDCILQLGEYLKWYIYGIIDNNDCLPASIPYMVYMALLIEMIVFLLVYEYLIWYIWHY